MPRKIVTLAAAFLGLAAAFFSTNNAKASEWGCEVLLCAASNNPSWQQIPFCQPPMTKLIACLSATNPCSWPQCTQAGTGAPGHDPYEQCPTGWNPRSSNEGERGTKLLDQCARQVANSDCINGRDCDTHKLEIQPRARRSDPYFFNIKDDATGKVGTHWFNLRK